jgi:hypothetical protein
MKCPACSASRRARVWPSSSDSWAKMFPRNSFFQQLVVPAQVLAVVCLSTCLLSPKTLDDLSGPNISAPNPCGRRIARTTQASKVLRNPRTNYGRSEERSLVIDHIRGRVRTWPRLDVLRPPLTEKEKAQNIKRAMKMTQVGCK